MTGTGRLAAMWPCAWCMVVEPSRITSAPSSSMQRMAQSTSFGKTTSSLPPSRFSTSGITLMERMEASLSATPYSCVPFL